jgi:hypothetical protein
VKQRSLAKEILKDALVVAEMGAFTFKRDGGGEEIKHKPFVYVPNLIKTASDLVEKHRQYKPESYTILLHYYCCLLIGHPLGSHGMRVPSQAMSFG